MCKRTFLLTIFFVVITSLFSETWIYEKEVVIIPVGEEEHEIRLNYNDKEMQSGPTSFAIDEEENIYIRTSRKNILKKFDKNGKYICSSKFEKGLGDAIRFIGYNNGIIYTMSGNSTTNPVIRRYDKELNLIDCHKIKKDFKRQWIGLSFICNYKNEFGFLSNHSPQNISFRKIDLQDNHWRMRGTKLMDFDYNKVDLQKHCQANAFQFINYDNNDNLYFVALTGFKKLNKILIEKKSETVIKTNLLIDMGAYHGIAFMDGCNPFVSREGDVYNIIPLKDGFRFVKWHKIREEK
jgi:hypothetical protein